MRRFSVSYIRQHPAILRDPPFQVTFKEDVVSELVRPGMKWRECENCGDSTVNSFKFKSGKGKWQKLVLCDKCRDKYA